MSKLYSIAYLASLLSGGSALPKVKETLESYKEFSDDIFDKLLVRKDLPHLMLTDVNDLLMGMQADFPD